MKTGLVIVSVVAVLLAVSTGLGYWMLRDTNAELDSTMAELTSTNAELTEIEEVCPPIDFQDRSELVSWREATGIVGEGLSWVDRCLKLQEIGLSDGYILSMDVDVDVYDDIYVSLTAIAGENFYTVYPDELELYLIGLVY